MLFTFAEYFLQINFISLDALLRNSEQIKLSEFLKRNKNLTKYGRSDEALMSVCGLGERLRQQ